MTPISAKVKNIYTTFVNAVKVETSGLVTFEYTADSLKIKPVTKSDHYNFVIFLKDKGIEFFTYNSNLEQNIKYVVAIVDGVRSAMLLPL